MKLYLSPTSPFARKVKVALLEKKLDDETEWVVLDPWASPAELLAVNPLSQVPTLVLDDGTALVGSDSIIGALEDIYPEPSLFPPDRKAQTRTLAVTGLAHGLIECIVQIVLERRRAAGQRSTELIERRHAAVARVLETLDRRFARPRDHFHLDAIGVACALAYLDFRLGNHDWRERYGALADWQDWAAARSSLRASAPPPTTGPIAGNYCES